MAVTCQNDPGQANPESGESLVLTDTPLYGTVRVGAWHQVHPLIHGDRAWFAEPPPAGSAADFPTSAPASGPRHVSANPPGPARDGPKAQPAARHPAIQSRREAAKRTNKKPKTALYRLKHRLRRQAAPKRTAVSR